MALQRAFLQNDNLLVAVIDGATLEEAEATADALATVLATDTAHFIEVRRPDASPYLERIALLVLDTARLSALLDQPIAAQTYLGQLAANLSLRRPAGALPLIAKGVRAGQANLAPSEPPLQGSMRRWHRRLPVGRNRYPGNGCWPGRSPVWRGNTALS